MKKKNYTDYQEYLIETLKDEDEALAYLNAASKDEDPRIFLLALKNVAEAQGKDVRSIAELTDLNTQNLYRILSKKGNPRWESLRSVINALGFEFELHYKHK